MDKKTIATACTGARVARSRRRRSTICSRVSTKAAVRSAQTAS
jgi:hypothetical protein